MKTLKNIFTTLLVTLVIAGVAVAQGTKDNPRVIEMKGTDNMKFDVTQIDAQPGETIKIVLTTISRIPKQAMAHNVVVLDAGVDMRAFVNESAKASANKYVAPELEDQVLAYTDLAGGGETVDVTFTLPNTPGDYEYVCSFPGHYYGGMKGVITVKQVGS